MVRSASGNVVLLVAGPYVCTRLIRALLRTLNHWQAFDYHERADDFELFISLALALSSASRSAVDAVIWPVQQLAAQLAGCGTLRMCDCSLLVTGTQTDLWSCACNASARAVRLAVSCNLAVCRAT